MSILPERSEAQTRTSFRIVAVAVPAPLALVALSVKLAESCRPRLSAAAGSCTVSFSAVPDGACPITVRIRNVFGFLPFLPVVDFRVPVSFTWAA